VRPLIRQLSRKLGNDSQHPIWILRVPGIGYRKSRHDEPDG